MTFKQDKTKEWALRYGLLESIQIVIDLSCHLVVKQNIGNADTYSDCIRLLAKFDILDEALEDHLQGHAGLHNILVHEYVSVDLNNYLTRRPGWKLRFRFVAGEHPEARRGNEFPP